MRIETVIIKNLRRKGYKNQEQFDAWFEKFGAAKRRKLIRLAEVQRYKCCYCKSNCWLECYGETGVRRKKATIEHVVPLALGGNNSMFNMVMSCEACNTKRGSAFDAFEFEKIIESGNYKKPVKYTNQELINKKHENSKERRDKLIFYLAYLLFLCQN